MAAKKILDVKLLILQKLNEHPSRPAELIEQLRSPEVTEACLKDVLAELVDERKVEFTSDRHIQLREHYAAAAS